MRAWVMLSAGHGPPECAWVVHHLGPVFAAAATSIGLTCTEISRTPGPTPDTAMSLVFELAADNPMDNPTDNLDGFIAGWQGTLQWVGRSPLRPEHRRRNWFVKLVRLPVEQSSEHPELRAADLEFTALRSSGAGGQNVNKRSTAVRLRHLPTGLTVVARDDRSQAQNRRLAHERLAALLLARAFGDQAARQTDRWSAHNTLERGNPRKVFRGAAFTPT